MKPYPLLLNFVQIACVVLGLVLIVSNASTVGIVSLLKMMLGLSFVLLAVYLYNKKYQ